MMSTRRRTSWISLAKARRTATGPMVVSASSSRLRARRSAVWKRTFEIESAAWMRFWSLYWRPTPMQFARKGAEGARSPHEGLGVEGAVGEAGLPAAGGVLELFPDLVAEGLLLGEEELELQEVAQPHHLGPEAGDDVGAR
jgi:hypothetical protein